ncbi:hypothetical protein Tco_1321440 [Tanacetum coccineum]
MENEHELGYETLTRVYLGSYEHYKGVVAGLRFSTFFNDPRIIWEQRIAAYKGYRGGVSGQMTHYVASLTLDNAISCVMQGAFCTQRKVSMVSFGRISPNRFLSSILLVVVIIITVVIVVVILVVVIFAIVEVVIVVVVVNSWNLLTLGLRYFPFDPQIVVLISLLYSHRWEMHIHQDKICQLKYHVHRLLLFPQHICFERILILVRSNHSGRVLVSLLALCHGSSLGFQGCSKNRMSSLPDGIQIRECDAKALRGYGMIHEDGDNDTNDGDDDGRER